MNTSTLRQLPQDFVPAPRSEEQALSTADLPPVRVLLASLLWLAAKQRECPMPATLRAIALQLQRLALHPEASAEDKRAGLRLACETYHDALLWLGDGNDAGAPAH